MISDLYVSKYRDGFRWAVFQNTGTTQGVTPWDYPGGVFVSGPHATKKEAESVCGDLAAANRGKSPEMQRRASKGIRRGTLYRCQKCKPEFVFRCYEDAPKVYCPAGHLAELHEENPVAE